jgi:CBS domain containing-hemolysin-like protein
LIQIQDVLAWKCAMAPLNIRTLIRDIIFIAPTMRTLDLLFQMREQGIRMAIVVDEYGGVDGLVTFSDLLEKIIGDIQDARDHREPSLTVRPDGTIVTDGRVNLEELKEDHNLDLMVKGFEDEVETIGGLVSALMGRVPSRGEIIKHPNGKHEFEVLESDLRRVKRVLIRRLSDSH